MCYGCGLWVLCTETNNDEERTDCDYDSNSRYWYVEMRNYGMEKQLEDR